MLKVDCNICQNSFEAPVSNLGELSYQKCQSMFTMSYGLKLPCPKCKSILKLQKTGENTALGSSIHDEQSNTQEKTQLVDIQSIQAPEKNPKTKKVKINVQLDSNKALTDPKTAKAPEIISEKTKIKPFKILPQILQNKKDFKLELKDTKSQSFNFNSNHLLALALGFCVFTLSLFVFSLFKEKPLQVEDQTVQSKIQPTPKATRKVLAKKAMDTQPLAETQNENQNTVASKKETPDGTSKYSVKTEELFSEHKESGEVADKSMGITKDNVKINLDNDGLNNTQKDLAELKAQSNTLNNKKADLSNSQVDTLAQTSPLDIQHKHEHRESFQGGVEEDMNVKDEVLSYESFQVDTERYKKTLLHLPDLKALTSSYGIRLDPFTHQLANHRALDFRGKIGDPVKAALDGTVSYAGKKGRYGNVLILKHANGYETRYAHLSRFLVKKGDKVSKGDVVAKIGNTGRSTGPHLHFELLKGEKKLNPLTVDLKIKK